MSRPMWGCMLDMALAYHFSGDKQVKKVAKMNTKKVARSSRPVLQAITKARRPGGVVMAALESMEND